MSDLDLRQLARETVHRIFRIEHLMEAISDETVAEDTAIVLSALERAVSSRDEEWTQTLLPEIPGLRKATPAGVRRGVEERMAAALSAERARVLEKACAAVCVVEREGIKLPKVGYFHSHECMALRRAFAEEAQP